MSSQVPMPPDLPAHDDEFDDRQTDQGVPVGDADVEADRRNASGDEDGSEGVDLAALDEQTESDGGPLHDAQSVSSDDGDAVGRADLDADRKAGSGDR
ncbi:hypothetical protein [Terracoccus luteus]|uniref:Uncharacterized protein n=1 Tax=Terracoccus luteus TaxID=53356 RepID=A0A839PUP2_9MICO|nr:hypothetical protein [Terracoccus luteus]MBB2987237.1 hypothetical protein [Terracoccus luteus]MCP2172888.1 hypothetical protein [Terracoccus luteus]